MAHIDFSHGGNARDFACKGKKNIIDFSANINPLGLPREVKKAVRENLDEILRYPDAKARDITRNIARYWGIDERNVLLGNGSVELIYLIAQTFKPRLTLIPTPSFSEYERAARNAGSKIRFLPLREKEGFRLDLPRYERADLFFLCNPNNPTGNLILEKRKLPKQAKCKHFVIDEAFMDFLPGQKKHTLVREAVKTEKIAVLRTFTKFFALPGLRIGYAVAHKNTIDRLKRNQPPWSTNSLAQLTARTMLSDKDYSDKTYRIIAKEREFLFAELSAIKGLEPYPSKVNFILIKIEKGSITSKALQHALIKKGFLVRDCSDFRNLGKRYIRIAVRSHKENTKLLNAFRKTL